MEVIKTPLVEHFGGCHCRRVRCETKHRPLLLEVQGDPYHRQSSLPRLRARCEQLAVQVKAPARVTVLDCNCSICIMKQNKHFVVPKSCFELLHGEDNLTLYQFNTMRARHLFCNTCGVQSFYVPRSNPDGIAVTAACVDAGTLESVEMRQCDGAQWERFMGGEGANIRQMSEPVG